MSESLVNWDAYLQIASHSDVGMRRMSNQDNLCVSPASNMEHWQKRGHLFVVADGMGAHAAGEFASKLAIDHIPHLYGKYENQVITDALRKSVEGANVEIHRRGQANEEFHNMGTTCSTLALLPQGALVAHVGDSRVYRLRQNRLEQLTFDHSLVWEMKASGQLQTEEESAKIPKNVITRSLGPYAEVKVDLEGPFPIEVGDTFLLCSDGLTGPISDAEIGAILANLHPDEAARVLVDLANLRGGPDNITVVIVKVIHPQLATSDSAGNFVSRSGGSQKILNPISIGVLVFSILAAILIYFINPIAAAIPGAIAAGCLVWVLVQLGQAVVRSDEQVSEKSSFGRGPYTRTDCASAEGVVQQLMSITSQLQEGARQQKWPVDYAQMDKMVASANQAAEQKNFPVAIQTFARSISFLMEQLRNDTDASSSSIEL